MTQKYDRFKAAPWFQEGIKPPVLVGGAGGIGSWLTVLLNRAGFETYVFDFDVLEEINMAGQLFMHDSIGKPKVTALDEITYRLCREHIVGNNEKVTEETMTNEIVFAAFDNIKARRDMFVTWAQNYRGRPDAIFIDGRLTAEQLTIFSIKGDDEFGILEYQSDELPDDSTIPELDCTLKQTSHGAAMIAAHMVEMFTNWYSGVLGKDDSRNVPYFWEYIIPLGFTSQRNSIRPTDSPAGYKYVEGVGHVIDTPSLQESKEQAEDTGIFVDNTPEQQEKINEIRNLVMQDTSEIGVEAARERATARYQGWEVGPLEFHGMLVTRSDGSQYLIRPDGSLKEWTTEDAETQAENEDIARSLTGGASNGYVIGVDTARTGDESTAVVTIYGTAGEFQGGEEAERVFYNPTEEPTPQPDLPGIDGRPFTINLGDEAFGVPRQPQDPLQDELQRASEELGRWADTQITNGPVPGNSILEENDGQTEQNSDL